MIPITLVEDLQAALEFVRTGSSLLGGKTVEDVIDRLKAGGYGAVEKKVSVEFSLVELRALISVLANTTPGYSASEESKQIATGLVKRLSAAQHAAKLEEEKR